MNILSKKNKIITELAEMAIESNLYVSEAWTMYGCYTDIINDSEVSKTSELIVLEDNDKLIGSIFFNNEFCHFYYGYNTQIFITPDNRGKGLGKFLFSELNLVLKENKFNGTLRTGRGISGSDTFWTKMSNLHKEDNEHYMPLIFSDF